MGLIRVRSSESGDVGLIVGRSLTDVAQTIKREFRWKRIAANRWLTSDYREIVYLNDCELLDRYDDNCTVYLTPGVTERDDWYEFEAALVTHRARVVEL